MASNRTGTAQWQRIRTYTKRQAQADGLTNCPACGVQLDYDKGRTPNSAEVDHITPHAQGGTDAVDNLTILCRRCNQSKGSRSAPKISTILAAKPLKTSSRWA